MVSISFSTDKQEYQSAELMSTYIEITSPQYVGEALSGFME